MKKLSKLTALLLAVILAVSALAGCNKEKDDTPEGYVYVPSYTDFPFEVQYIERAKAIGDRVYILAPVIDGKITDTWVDEDGVEHEEEYDKTVTKLFSIKNDGSDPKEYPGYLFDSNDEKYGWSYPQDIVVDESGRVNIIIYNERYIFDLPEDFDAETDSEWNYQTGYTVGISAQALAEDGTVVETRDIYTDDSGNANGIGSVLCGEDGNWYLYDYQNLMVIGRDGKEIFRTEDNNVNSLVNLPGGKIGATFYGDTGMGIKIFDSESKAFGEAIPLPQDCYNIVGSNEEYDIIYNQYNSLYGYKLETQQKEKILDWLDADIDANNLSTVSVLEDGNIFCISNSWTQSGNEVDVINLVRKNASEVEQKKVITMATMYLDWSVREMVLEYNKTNPEYRIKVTIYNEYNTNEDSSLGLTKLNAEIIAGNVPDIICCSTSMPTNRYAAKGLLEDLTPYIENSVGTENIVEPFFNALRDSEGKLYEIYPNFSLRTAVGFSSIVGDGSSWTFDDLYAAMEKLPEGAQVFENYYTKSTALNSCVGGNIDYFVDWDTGECRFDSEEFIELLEFANTFKDDDDSDEDYDYEESYKRLLSGKQLLYNAYLYSVDDFRSETFYRFGKDISFVGYPTLSGTGSSFSVNGAGFAMSSQCQYKDAVWDFIGQVLTEEFQNENGYWWGVPTNKKSFDKMFEESMTPTFSEDALEMIESMNGAYKAEMGIDAAADAGEDSGEDSGEKTPSLVFNEGQVNDQGWHEEPKTWLWDGDRSIPVYAMTEYEYEAIMDLINSTTSMYRYDDKIIQVLNEETQAYFQGQKSVEDTAKMIQSKVKLYVSEQK